MIAGAGEKKGGVRDMEKKGEKERKTDSQRKTSKGPTEIKREKLRENLVFKS